MRITTGLHVLIAPKKDIFYSLGRSKSMAPSQLMSGTSDNEKDPEYVPPGAMPITPAAQASQGIPPSPIRWFPA